MSASNKQYALCVNVRTTVTEMQELLDGYTLDEIQVMIQQRAFSDKLYKELRPYLVERAKKMT